LKVAIVLPGKVSIEGDYFVVGIKNEIRRCESDTNGNNPGKGFD